ncbi:hypothetical protein MSHOH_2164 [Methanosarcina horonobensis HB-1 = JCM 15518]|uniref:Uncharacterized protein n=1 Tax=Methanosarcina horonobensis HB-1 = JCM 15518 TaxID=1434110 RepID=A0A0E3SEN2_9EURY|nr:hypothetical protein [Methanosarcina horonobensis]AKB78647.1 hypothetical protein MSHOH_2164 [Methanosarcina horonobensis HB-1 = JCM 15518]
MAKTGSVTIKGRNGTSASGKTVSVYSPQYSATTGQDAPDRGTTSAAVQLSDEFTEEQKEAAKNTGLSYQEVKAQAAAEEAAKQAAAQREAQALAEEAEIRNALTKSESGNTQEELSNLYQKKLAGEYNPSRGDIVNPAARAAYVSKVEAAEAAAQKTAQKKAEAKEAEAAAKNKEKIIDPSVGLTEEFYSGLGEYTPEQQQKLIEGRLKLRDQAEQSAANQGHLYDQLAGWQDDYKTATKDVTKSKAVEVITGLTSKAKEKLSTVADNSVLDIPLTSLGTVIGGAGSVIEHSEAAIKTGGKSLSPDIKTLAVGTAITPFATVDAAANIAGTKGTKIDTEAVQLLSDVAVTTAVLGLAGKAAKPIGKSSAKLIESGGRKIDDISMNLKPLMADESASLGGQVLIQKTKIEHVPTIKLKGKQVSEQKIQMVGSMKSKPRTSGGYRRAMSQSRKSSYTKNLMRNALEQEQISIGKQVSKQKTSMLQLSSLVSTGATIKGLATQIPQQKQLLGQVQQPSILNIPKITPKEQSTQAQVTPAIFKSVNKSRYDQPSLSIPQISPAPAETPKQNPIYPIIFSRDPAPKKAKLKSDLSTKQDFSFELPGGNFGSRTKKHYVQDPAELIFGKKKK